MAASDRLGDLGRSVASLLGRLREHQDYLRNLADKLIDNAVDFSPEGSRIEIELKRHRNALTLTVFNPGPPLPEGGTERLFESMVSARREKSDQVHLGLGLAIARLIADFHGGHLSAANVANGVRFTMRLPA